MPRPAKSTTAPPRRRNARGEGVRLRADIVAAAGDLLIETGEAGSITLRAVARRAGIAAPSIYPHFANPQQILLAVVVDQFEVLQGALRDAVDSAPDDPRARLLAWTVAYLDYARDRPQHYLVMFGGVWVAAPAIEGEDVAAADVEALGADLLGLLGDLLADCAEAGSSEVTDPYDDATLLWVGLHGLAQQRIASPRLAWPAHVAERLVERLALLGS